MIGIIRAGRQGGLVSEDFPEREDASRRTLVTFDFF